LVGFGEVDLEECPSFVGFELAAPFTAALWEHTGVRNEGVGVGDDLGGCVRTAACVGVVHCILDLGIKGFDRLVWVVWFAEDGVVVGQIVGSDVTVGLHQMFDEVSRGGVGETSVSVL